MRAMVVVIGLLVAANASAAPKPKPLPGGMKVVTKLGRPYVQQGATTVALRDDDVADYEKISKAELAPDGKTIEVTAARCKGELPDEVTKVPLAKVQARFDNAAGLVAHGKKQYAVAIAKFGSALAKDAARPAYATNLLAAQLLGKKPALAGQTLAVHGRRNPVWFGWQMMVQPDLATAKDLKGAQDLFAASVGTATLAKLGDRDLAATAHGGGMVALRTLSIGSPGTTEVDFVSLSSGQLLARFPLVTLEDACDETEEHPCGDEAKIRIADRVKLLDRLFAVLGFQVTANAFVDVRNGDPVTKDGISIDISDDSISASRGGSERKLALDGNVWAVAFMPKAIVVKLNRRKLYGCNDGSSRFAGIALALP